jgi:hypothetical protein
MPVLDQIAYNQGRRDEVPNQELARQLAESSDEQGVAEIAANLWYKNPNVQSDCLKVLYETGYLAPEMVAPYWQDFLKLLKSRNNRLVWGAMIALATVASLKADELFPHAAEIQQAMEKGSVITVDNGVKTLALIAAARDDYNKVLFPYLLEHLRTCRPKEVPQHAESTLVAGNRANQAAFIQVLEARLDHATDAQQKRLKKVMRAAAAK